MTLAARYEHPQFGFAQYLKKSEKKGSARKKPRRNFQPEEAQIVRAVGCIVGYFKKRQDEGGYVPYFTELRLEDYQAVYKDSAVAYKAAVDDAVDRLAKAISPHIYSRGDVLGRDARERTVTVRAALRRAIDTRKLYVITPSMEGGDHQLGLALTRTMQLQSKRKRSGKAYVNNSPKPAMRTRRAA